MRAILTYHSIDPSGSVISVDPAAFRRHVDWLASGAVRVVPVAELLAGEADGGDRVAITFDDGFENFAGTAWPLLRDRDLPVTVFVVSDRVGGTNAWEAPNVADPDVPVLPLMGWDTLGRIAEEGATIESHTRTHPSLAGLDAARLADEVEGSADRIESEIGRRPDGFAYPYGRLDDAGVAAVSGAYAWACTTRLAAIPDVVQPHRLPRLDAFYYRRPGQLEAWGRPAFHVRLAARRAAREAREALRGGVV